MNKLSSHLTKLIIFILPLFFLPVTRDFFDFNKNMLLMAFALFLTAIFLVKIILASTRGAPVEAKHGIISQFRNFAISPLSLPILALALAYLVSLLLSSPNKVEALLQPGGAGTIFALTLIYFLLPSLPSEALAKEGALSLEPRTGALRAPLLASAVVLSLISVVFLALDSFGIKTLSFANLEITTAGFTPAGSSLSLASFLAVALIIALTCHKREKPAKPVRENELREMFNPAERDEVQPHKAQKSLTSSISQHLNIAISITIFLGLLSTLYLLFQPERRPLFLPVSAGWTVALESFKNPKNLIFGVGPGNFLNAFTRARPIELNASNLWPFRFGLSSNFYLHVLTETGLLGLAALLFLIYNSYKSYNNYSRYNLILIFLLFALIPANILLLFVLYLLLASEPRRDNPSLLPKDDPLSEGSAKAVMEDHPFKGNFVRDYPLTKILASLVLLLIAFSFYLLGRAYAAEVSMFQGLRAAQQNRGQETYDRQRQALILNPRNSSYRMIFAQTNLALANSLATKEEITDADRQTILQLVNQTIVNAKLAVQLTPSVVTWENLASIYAALINVAQGADQWAVSSYNQAISLEPTNPALRVSFGGFYYGLGQLLSKAEPQRALSFYETAARQFEIAVNLKPDLANPWYNLANAQREAGRIEQARFSYQQTLALLDPQANEYQRVKEELEALPKPPATPPQALETLSAPASPSAELEPKLELGEEASPPAEILSPTETPSPSPSPSPSLSPTLTPLF